MRRQLQDVCERVAQLQREHASLLEVEHQLKLDESGLLTRLAAVRQECELLDRTLEQERRRAAAVEAEIEAVEQENAALQSACAALERHAEQLGRQLEAMSKRLSAYRDKRAFMHGVIADAVGGLSQMERKLSDQSCGELDPLASDESDQQ